jgi:ribosomal protein L15E
VNSFTTIKLINYIKTRVRADAETTWIDESFNERQRARGLSSAARPNARTE